MDYDPPFKLAQRNDDETLHDRVKRPHPSDPQHPPLYNGNRTSRGCSSMAEHELPKLGVGVRFPSPALF